MSDLPLFKLRLFKPPFWSTGMDCFGPFNVKIGRRTEKRWGILFKCQTTRCLHLDLLTSLDVDSFLMALRRFISRRGQPSRRGPDSSLPQVIYANTELLGRRSWRHSQVLADQFWASFIRHYLPGQQLRQKWNREHPNLNDSAVYSKYILK